MTNPNRLKDLADVQEPIRALKLPRDLGKRLHPSVRDQFFIYWDGLQGENEA